MKHWDQNKKIGIEIEKSLGNTNTNSSISDLIVSDFVDINNVNKNTCFLEPAVGAGSFYFSILNFLIKNNVASLDYIVENMIYAYDVDARAINLIKDKLLNDYGYVGKKLKVFNNDYLLLKENKRFDYVITNPPYISSKNIKPKNTTKEKYFESVRKINQIDFDNKSDIYVLFYLKTIKLLKHNGKQIFLCSDGWVDANYGKSIRDIITNEEYSLEHLINSPLHPFFRDDTNAIITVISNSKNKNSRIISSRTPIEKLISFNNEDYFNIEKKELIKLFNNKDIYNIRNVLVLFGNKYYENKKIIAKYDKYFCRVSDLIAVSNSNVSKNDLERMELLEKNNGKGLPLFWQEQVWGSKIPNYKNEILTKELAYKIKKENLESKLIKHIKNKSVYLSGIIDRFPLLFFLNNKSFHVSKYMHLYSENLNSVEICLTMNNIFTLYYMELDLKEGTRKSSRIGERGLTKEINKDNLINIKCLDITKFSVESRIELNNLGNKYKDQIMYKLQDAISDKTYMDIQHLIAKELGVSATDFDKIKEKLMEMYWFRMRKI